MSGFKFFRDPSQRNREEPRDPFKSGDWTDYGSPDDERPVKFATPAAPAADIDPFTDKPVTPITPWWEEAAAAAPAVAPAAAPVRTRQQKQLINPEREAERKGMEALEKAKGAPAKDEKGRGAGQGLTTGGLDSGGFGTGRRVGRRGY